MHKNKKPGNNNFFFRFSLSLIFWQLFVFLVLAAKAQAGGYDESTPSITSPSLAAPDRQSPVISLSNWDKWETPYWLNSNICRENNGNIICLSPQIARQMRWKIPSKNESINPQQSPNYLGVMSQ